MAIFSIILFIAGIVVLVLGLLGTSPGLLTVGIVLAVVGFSFYIFSGFRTVRPTQKGLIERFGKYMRTKESGLTWIIPLFEKMYRVNSHSLLHPMI